MFFGIYGRVRRQGTVFYAITILYQMYNIIEINGVCLDVHYLVALWDPTAPGMADPRAERAEAKAVPRFRGNIHQKAVPYTERNRVLFPS